MCTLHDILSSKIRFIDTSTVTGSDSYSRKKLRVRLAYILITVTLVINFNVLNVVNSSIINSFS